MSSSSLTDRLPRAEQFPTVPSRQWLRRPIVGLAFWTAVVLPFLHVPLLVSGLETATSTTAFLVLVAVNFLALLIGHSHRGS